MLSREEAIKFSYEQGNGDDTTINEIYESIVHCKDCRYGYLNEDCHLLCSRGNFDPIEEDFYCADGERKEDD